MFKNIYLKINEFGSSRIIGSAKHKSKREFFNFGYDKKSGFLLIDKDSQNIFSILDKDLSSVDIQEYLSLMYRDFKVEIIPEQFYFNNQKTTDTILFKEDNEGNKFAFIDREFPPYGYALAGGMVDKGEDSLEANFRELKEELNAGDVELVQDFGSIKSYEIRGSLHTRLVLVKANNPSEIVAGDDAASFIWLSKEEVLEKISNSEIIPHHVDLINKGFEFLYTPDNNRNIKQKKH